MASTVWKGHLSFGLISIPVRLFRAGRAERVSLRELYRAALKERGPAPSSKVIELPVRALEPEPELEPVRHTVTTASREEPVARENIVKGYEYAPDQYVVVEKEDLKRITPPTSKTMDILEFVRFAGIDPIYLETSYYVAPDKGGDKPYALLYQALRESGLAGLAELAMHNRDHVMIVRAGRTGLIAHTMFYEDEIRREQEYRTEVDAASKRESDLARKLVESLESPFEPEKYRDRFRERLNELINAKVEGREVEAPKVPDLLSALEHSLAAVKKPPASEPARKRKKAKA
jgi:DNA end-binding protein Ku